MPYGRYGGGFIGAGGLFSPMPSLMDAIGQREDRNMAQLGQMAQLSDYLAQAGQRRQQESRLRDALAAQQQQEQQQQEQFQGIVAGLPEEQRAAALLAGREEFGKLLSKSLFETPKPEERYKVVGGALVDISGKDGPKEVYKGSATEKMSSTAQMLTDMGVQRGSPQWNKAMSAALHKDTHFAPTQPLVVNYGAPIPVQDPQDPSKLVYAQPSNRGGIEPTKLRPPTLAQEGKTGAAGGKMPAEIQRMDIALDSALSGLDQWDAKLKDYDPRSMKILSPNWRAKINSASADLKMQLKEANALGALTGPDVAILEDLIGTPGSASAPYYGRKGLQAKAQEARDAIKRRKEALSLRYREPSVPTASQAPSPDASPGDGWGELKRKN